MKQAVLVLTWLLIASAAHAQDRKATMFFLAGAASDDITTWRVMQAGHIEEDPLYFYAREKPKGVIASLVVTDIVTIWLAHHYAASHPKLAKFALYSLGAMRIQAAIHNVRLDQVH